MCLKVVVHTPSFSNCFGACSSLCMKYCSVSNYFTRAYAIYIYIFILSLYSLYFILLLLLSLLLLFSFLLVFFFFSLFLFLLFVQSGVIRKLFGLHCFPFNIMSFACLQCTCLFRKHSFRTFRLRKIALWGAN